MICWSMYIIYILPFPRGLWTCNLCNRRFFVFLCLSSYLFVQIHTYLQTYYIPLQIYLQVFTSFPLINLFTNIPTYDMLGKLLCLWKRWTNNYFFPLAPFVFEMGFFFPHPIFLSFGMNRFIIIHVYSLQPHYPLEWVVGLTNLFYFILL
jgi:hypothetical protein